MRSLLFSFLILPLLVLRAAAAMPPAPEAGWWALAGAYAGEMRAIRENIPVDREIARETILGGTILFAEVKGRHVVIFETGVSMVNAAMMLQALFERVPVRGVIFAGVAGGIDPELKKGDVVIPAEWFHHSEAAYFNETAPGSGEYTKPNADWAKYPRGNFGMMHPTPTSVRRVGDSTLDQREMFPACPELLKLAEKTVAEVKGMRRHGGGDARVVVGGAGVAGMVFMDNRAYREFIFKAWGARCLDMESSALAQVAFVNRKPILIIRALSDLAGGQHGVNDFVEAAAHAEDNAAKFLSVLIGKLPN